MTSITTLVRTVALGAALALSASCSSNAGAQTSAEKTTNAQTVALTVEGMTCASCSVAVRTALKKLDGVKDAKISVSENRAVIEYEPAKVTPRQMVEAVNKLGYQASLPAKGS